MAKQLDRGRIKAEIRELLRSAQVSPRGMTALYRGLVFLMTLLVFFSDGAGLLSVFITVLSNLILILLEAGFALYCMAVRRRERAEYMTLFDGFSLAGKLILLYIVQGLLVSLWSMLFIVPGFIAWYRYRFAVYALLENPRLSPLEALALSRRLTQGYKGQLFRLDLSYLGWFLLTMLPQMVESALALAQNPDPMAYLAAPLTLPALLVQEVWALGAYLLFYPNYICAVLAYYEAGRGEPPVPESQPDDLGGWS